MPISPKTLTAVSVLGLIGSLIATMIVDKAPIYQPPINGWLITNAFHN